MIAPDVPLRRALVLGATGAIGRVLAPELLSCDAQVTVSSRSEAHLAEAFGPLPVERVPVDATDAAQVARAAEGCDVVFSCVGAPLDRFELHERVADAVTAAAATVGARVVAVTAFWSFVPHRSLPGAEDDPRQPEVPQARHRKAMEDRFLDAGACVAVLPDFYGPGIVEQSSFLNEGLKLLRAGKPLLWIGDPDARRDFLYVPDVAAPLVALARRRAAGGRLVNIPGAGPRTPRSLLEEAAAALDRKAKVRRLPPFLLTLAGLFSPTVKGVRQILPLYQQPTALDGSRLEALIGPSHVTPYAEGLAATLRWLAEQERSAA